jgi:uncharacterized protein
MGNPFCHIELATGDADKASTFYKKLFTWKLAKMPMGGSTYTVIDMGMKDAGGGIMGKMMPEQPTAWMPYVLVDSVKKAVAKAAKLGAQVIVPYQDIPGHGACGIFTDPTGATIGVYEAIKKAPAKKAAKKVVKKKGKK